MGLGDVRVLLFYVVIALLFDRAVVRCVETLETQPGQSTVASIMTVVLVPVMFVVLAISVIGIVVIPFAGMALMVASLFGKAVALAALGRRVTRFTGIAPLSHIAFATFVGGPYRARAIRDPGHRHIAYKLLGIIGLAVVYTILLAISGGPRIARLPWPRLLPPQVLAMHRSSLRQQHRSPNLTRSRAGARSACYAITAPRAGSGSAWARCWST